MVKLRSNALAVAVLLAMTSATVCRSQAKGPSVLNTLGLAPLPGILRNQETALGARMRTPGKELAVYVGALVDASGRSSQAQVQYQLPNLVRLDGFANGRVLTFDGGRKNGIVSEDEDSYLNVFLIDFPEAMFNALRNGAALRHIGSGFRPDPRSAPNYKGPRLDIFSVTGAVPGGPSGSPQSTTYLFDSDSGLLQIARSSGQAGVSRPTQTETRFSNWGEISGSKFPGRIDHYQDGRLLFTFVVNTISSTRAANPSQFR